MKKNFILRLNLTANNLTLVRAFITQVLEYAKIPGKDSLMVEMAVNELCENVLNHGYDGKGGELDLRLNIEAKKIRVTVIDRGKAYNLENYKPKPLAELVEKGVKGSLGIRIIKTMSDKISYTRLNNKNKTVLTRNFEAEAAE